MDEEEDLEFVEEETLDVDLEEHQSWTVDLDLARGGTPFLKDTRRDPSEKVRRKKSGRPGGWVERRDIYNHSPEPSYEATQLESYNLENPRQVDLNLSENDPHATKGLHSGDGVRLGNKSSCDELEPGSDSVLPSVKTERNREKERDEEEIVDLTVDNDDENQCHEIKECSAHVEEDWHNMIVRINRSHRKKDLDEYIIFAQRLGESEWFSPYQELLDEFLVQIDGILGKVLVTNHQLDVSLIKSAELDSQGRAIFVMGKTEDQTLIELILYAAHNILVGEYTFKMRKLRYFQDDAFLITAQLPSAVKNIPEEKVFKVLVKQNALPGNATYHSMTSKGATFPDGKVMFMHGDKELLDYLGRYPKFHPFKWGVNKAAILTNQRRPKWILDTPLVNEVFTEDYYDILDAHDSELDFDSEDSEDEEYKLAQKKALADVLERERNLEKKERKKKNLINNKLILIAKLAAVARGEDPRSKRVSKFDVRRTQKSVEADRKQALDKLGVEVNPEEDVIEEDVDEVCDMEEGEIMEKSKKRTFSAAEKAKRKVDREIKAFIELHGPLPSDSNYNFSTPPLSSFHQKKVPEEKGKLHDTRGVPIADPVDHFLSQARSTMEKAVCVKKGLPTSLQTEDIMSESVNPSAGASKYVISKTPGVSKNAEVKWTEAEPKESSSKRRRNRTKKKRGREIPLGPENPNAQPLGKRNLPCEIKSISWNTHGTPEGGNSGPNSLPSNQSSASLLSKQLLQLQAKRKALMSAPCRNNPWCEKDCRGDHSSPGSNIQKSCGANQSGQDLFQRKSSFGLPMDQGQRGQVQPTFASIHVPESKPKMGISSQYQTDFHPNTSESQDQEKGWTQNLEKSNPGGIKASKNGFKTNKNSLWCVPPAIGYQTRSYASGYSSSSLASGNKPPPSSAQEGKNLNLGEALPAPEPSSSSADNFNDLYVNPHIVPSQVSQDKPKSNYKILTPALGKPTFRYGSN